MRACRPRSAAFLLVLAALVLAPAATASGNAGVAALQVALRARGLYSSTIDGFAGPATTAAVQRFQHRTGLPATGIVDSRTRRALGRYGRHLLGSRPLTRGDRKSTRLNSSHLVISYAVFCLKKKQQTQS